MFLHLCVSHSVHGGVYPSMHWGKHPLGKHIPACTGADTPGHTVRILLECILVYILLQKIGVFNFPVQIQKINHSPRYSRD